MNFRSIIIVALLLGAIGCHPEKPKPKPIVVEASFKNSSSHALDWVTMEWAGPSFEVGVLPVGRSATYLDLDWPNVSTGKITFIDFKTRQPFNIALSLQSINEQIKSGGCRAITIRILDYDKAEIVAGSP